MASSVTVYTRNACGACLGTERYLITHGIDYEEINVEDPANEGIAQKLVDEGWRAMPVVKTDAIGNWAGMNRAKLDELAKVS